MRKIISIHVPKAAGSSFRLILNNMFGSSNVAPTGTSKEGFLNGPWRIMHGHFQLDNWKDEDVDLISILRDPIQRYLSYYNFWKYTMTLSHRNPNFLRFRKDDAPFLDFLNYDFMTKEGFEYVRPELTNRFKFIGTVEHFKKSIDTLASIYGLPAAPVGSKANSTQRRFDWDNLTSDEKDRVCFILKDEVAFYNKIKELEGGWNPDISAPRDSTTEAWEGLKAAYKYGGSN